MKSAQVLIADAQGAALADLLLDLEAGLLGVGILHVAVHGGEVDQRDQWDGALRMFGKHRSPSLCRRETHVDLAQIGEVGGVAGRQKRIGKRAQRNAVVEEPVAASHHGAPGFKGRPGKTHARRKVVPVGRDRFQELQVIPQAGIQSQARVDLPLVLSIEPDVRVGLRNRPCCRRSE